MKASAMALGFSALTLTVASLGLSLHAQAKPNTPSLHIETSAPKSAKISDADMIGVLGDVLVDGCKSGDAPCSKAWKDLTALSAKDAL